MLEHSSNKVYPPAPNLPAPVTPWWAAWLAGLALVLAALAAYSNSFHGPFIFDDLLAIEENPTITQGWREALEPPSIGQTVTGRPLVNLTFYANYALAKKYSGDGLKVEGYHEVNLAIHLLSGLTLFGLVRRTLLGPLLRARFGDVALPLGFMAALLWTLHPLQTESVTYVVQRAEALMALFYLLTMYAFARAMASPRAGIWYALSLTACALGMTCKEVMVSAPLMVLLYDRTFVAGTFAEAWRRRWPWYALLMLTWIPLICLVYQVGTRGESAGFVAAEGLSKTQFALGYIRTQLKAVVGYLGLCVWPNPLVLDRGRNLSSWSWSLVLCALVVMALISGMVYALVRRPKLGFIAFWFFAILAPSSSIVPIITETSAERRVYLALAAVTVLAVMGLYAWLGRRALPVALALAVALGGLTFARNRDYRSGIIMWSDCTAKYTGNARAHENLGIELASELRLRESIQEYQTALKLRPYYPDCENNLGNAFLELGRPQEAIAAYKMAIAQDPKMPQAYYDMGNALRDLGQLREATEAYAQAVKTNPHFPGAHNNLANMLCDSGQYDAAIAEYQAALRDQPNFAYAENGLGNAYVNSGHPDLAVQHYRNAIADMPNYAQAHWGLGNCDNQLNHLEDAVPEYQAAIRIDPNYADAHYNLALTYRRLGRLADAIREYEEVLRIAPNYPNARTSLADTKQQMGH